jgi:glycine cleavage system regulatory protein
VRAAAKPAPAGVPAVTASLSSAEAESLCAAITTLFDAEDERIAELESRLPGHPLITEAWLNEDTSQRGEASAA